MDAAALTAVILAFLREELGVHDAIAPGTSLLASGVVDSAGLVRLAAVLERETGREIPDRDLTPEHFDSIDRILRYLEQRS